MSYHVSLSSALSAEVALVTSGLGIDWASFNGTEELVAEMAAGGHPDTRNFLKPVYRVCKNICRAVDVTAVAPRTPECYEPYQKQVLRADGQDPWEEASAAAIRWRDHANFAQAIAVAEWVVALASGGDAGLGIPPQPQLQPQFVYNTIITMCQRASAALEAQATYARMCHHQLAPDVFTMTALVDVLGRSHDVVGSFWLYRRMVATHGLQPNVVTLVTASRVAIVHRRDDFFVAVLEDLMQVAGAETGGAATTAAPKGVPGGRTALSMPRTPSIVLLSAFECSLGSGRVDLAREVLIRARTLNLMPDLATVVRSLGPIWATHPELRSPIEALVAEGLLPEGAIEAIVIAQAAIGEGNPAEEALHYHRLDALGRNSSSEMRREVVEHDLEMLEARLGEGQVAITSGEYETLLHQCRKRKWSAEVSLVLAAMERLGAVDLGLAPTAATLLIAIDAFLDGNDLRGGWTLLKEAPNRWGFARSFDPIPAYFILCRGAIRTGEAELAAEAMTSVINLLAAREEKTKLVEMVRDGLSPAGKLLRGMLRGLGKAPKDGVDLVKKLHLVTSLSSVPPPSECWVALIALLAESCAVCANPEGSLFVFEETSLLTSQRAMILSPTVSMCIAMAAAASGMVFKDAETRVTTAHKFALGFSAFLPRLPIVNCLLEEAFQNCPHSTFKAPSTRRQRRAAASGEEDETLLSLPFNGFVRPNLLRLLHGRRSWLRRVMRLVVGGGSPEAIILNQNQSAAVAIKRKSGDEDDVDDEDAFMELSLAEVSDASERLASLEVDFDLFSDVVASRKGLTGIRSDAYLNALMGPGVALDISFGGTSAGLRSEEFVGLLRVQWLHVRCLAITSKETREDLITSIASSFAVNGREGAECLFLATLPCLECISPKLQARIAGFLADAFFQAFGFDNDSGRNEAFALSVALRLKGASLELLREAHKALLEPIGTTEAVRAVLVEATLGQLANTPTISTTMKGALFLKTLHSFIGDDQAMSIVALLLDLGPSSEGLEAALAFTKDAPRALVEVLSSRSDPHLTAKVVCRLGLASDYEHLLLPNSLIGAFEARGDTSMRDESVAFLRLHDLEPVAKVTQVCDLASVRAAAAALAAATVVGLDCEWRPYKKGMLTSPVSLLQISTPTESFLLDLLILKPPPPLRAATSFVKEVSDDNGSNDPAMPVASNLGECRGELDLEGEGLRFVAVGPAGGNCARMVHWYRSESEWARQHASAQKKHRIRVDIVQQRVQGDPCVFEVTSHDAAGAPVAAWVLRAASAAAADAWVSCLKGSCPSSPSSRESCAAGEECFQMVDVLFRRAACAKVGFGFEEDLRKLRESYPAWWGDVAPPQPLFDLHGPLPPDRSDGGRGGAGRGSAGGLSALAELHLGKPLDKRMQTSDWAARPLTQDQEEYAALDARCLVSLHEVLF